MDLVSLVIITFCFFIFLFSLFLLARDDFVFIRKDISLEIIFNLAFGAGLISLFGSRFIYILDNPDRLFLNPLAFVLFPYFPGLSLAGGVLTGTVFLLGVAAKRKLPIGRLLDFFSVSLLSTIPAGFGFYFLITGGLSRIQIGEALAYLILFILIMVIIQKIHRYGFKDGTLGTFFILFFSAVSLASEYFSKNTIFINVNNLILLTSFVLAILFLLKQEIIRRLVKYGKT